MDKNGKSVAEQHCTPQQGVAVSVLWKDVLTGQWKGPDQVLVWSRGAVCVFPQDQENPVWVPERLMRLWRKSKVEEYETPDDPLPDPDAPASGIITRRLLWGIVKALPLPAPLSVEGDVY